MPEIRIRVGAALEMDRNILSRTLAEDAKRARRLIEQELGGARRSTGNDPAVVAAKKAAGERVKATKEGADKETAISRQALQQQAAEVMRVLAIKRRAMREEAQERDRAAAAAQKAAQKEAKAAEETARAEERAAKRTAQAIRDRERARDHVRGIRERWEREQRRIATSNEESFGRRTSYRTLHNASGLARGASSVAQDIARGAGVNVDLAGSITRAVSLEKVSADIANSAAAAKGQSATAQDVADVQRSIVGAGDAARLDYGQVGTGLQNFLSRTGDLKTGKAILAELGDVARATASDFAEMASMAGEVSMSLPDSADKPEKVLAVVRMLAKQGAMANVEVRDLAKYGGRISAGAFMYEGSTDENIGRLGALAQIARKGGAATAAEATNSAQAFSRDLTKKAALKRFDALGLNVFSDESKTKLRDPGVIIKEYLEKTGGNLEDLATYFKNDVSKRVVKGVAATYQEAEGKQKGSGMEAVDKLFKNFTATLSKEAVAQSAALSKGGKEGRAQAIQNELDKVGMRIADRIIPRLEEFAPAALEATEALGDLAGWVAENPLRAAFAGLGASILKSVSESILRAGIESAIRGGATGVTAGGTGAPGGGGFMGSLAGVPGGAAGKALAGLGAAIAIAAPAVTIGQVGALVIDKVMDMAKEGDEKSEDFLVQMASARTKALVSGRPEDLEALKQIQLAAESRAVAASDVETGVFKSSFFQSPIGRAVSGAANWVTAGSVGTSFDAQAIQLGDKERLGQMISEMEKTTAAIQRLDARMSGAINVNIVSQPNGPPAPDAATRVGPSLE